MMRNFSRQCDKKPGPDMTPLMDVMFMLLLFFMLTSSFMKPSISLKLPKADNNDKLEKQNIIISAVNDNTIYFNKDIISPQLLAHRLNEVIREDPGKKIVFSGDESIGYKTFVKIMGIIKQSGAREINITNESE